MTSPDHLTLLSRGTNLTLGRGGPLVSVVLPVKNRARMLEILLPRIFGQRCDAEVELIAIDSGSDDSTVETLRSAGATVFAVPPLEFRYGRTRNEAARHAKGGILVFITSSILPCDDRWLATLIAPLQQDSMAGTFSRPIPHPDAGILAARDAMKGDLTGFRSEHAHFSGSTEIRRAPDSSFLDSLDPWERLRFISFSNPSAAVRASVLAEIPFPDAHICEDWLWGQKVLQAGYSIAYERSSVVLYSHDYTSLEYFRRSYDGGVFFRDILGPPENEDPSGSLFQLILDDWNFFENGLRQKGEQLAASRIDSVLRRCAEVAGQWMGRGHEELSDASSVRSLLARIVHADRSFVPDFMDAFDAANAPSPPVTNFDHWESSLKTELNALLNRPFGNDSEAADRLLRHAIARIGAALRALSAEPRFADVRSACSLIEQTRANVRTAEMEASRVGRSSFDAQWSSSVDSTALFATIELLQAEYQAAHTELEGRARLAVRLAEEITTRDSIITGLQAELFEKVDVRDEMIRSLQREMHEKIAEANEIIARLQRGQGG
jgi:rhamnosyltransferase